MGSCGVRCSYLQPRLPVTREQRSGRMHSSELGWPPHSSEVFLAPLSRLYTHRQLVLPRVQPQLLFHYSYLCLRGNWDKVEVLVGPKLYSLLSGDEKPLSLFLVITSAEVLYCLHRIAATRYELWMK